MKKNMFSLNFDPSTQPGHETRRYSLDGLLGDGRINQSYPSFNSNLMDKRDLRRVFKTQRDPRTLPSAWSMFKKVR